MLKSYEKNFNPDTDFATREELEQGRKDLNYLIQRSEEIRRLSRKLDELIEFCIENGVSIPTECLPGNMELDLEGTTRADLVMKMIEKLIKDKGKIAYSALDLDQKEKFLTLIEN